MRFFAPSRLRALAIMGGLVALVMSTQDSCTWLEFTDEDSVVTLDTEHACRIAKRITGLDQVACILVRSDHVAAEVRLGGDGRSVCLLRAQRWFVVDADAASDCPTVAPLPRERVFNLRGEQRLEQKWIEAIRRGRDEGARGVFITLLRTSIQKWRVSTNVPRTCPERANGGWVDAIDVDVTAPGVGAPWHYLTSDRIETMLTNAAVWGSGAQVRELQRTTPVLLFVDASEKKQPFLTAPGLFRAKVALIDWTRGEVFCEAEVAYEQSEDAPRNPESVAEFLPDFKLQVSEVLKSTTLSMTNGQLRVSDTW